MAYNNYPKLGWSSAQFMFSFSVIPVEDVVAISWTDKGEKKLMYGTGSEPIGYGIGNSEYEASITLYMEQVIAIASAAPQGKLTKIRPFDLVVQFTTDGSPLVQTVTLRNCMFKESKVSIKQGDLMIEQELPMICSGVELS